MLISWEHIQVVHSARARSIELIKIDLDDWVTYILFDFYNVVSSSSIFNRHKGIQLWHMLGVSASQYVKILYFII